MGLFCVGWGRLRKVSYFYFIIMYAEAHLISDIAYSDILNVGMMFIVLSLFLSHSNLLLDCFIWGV